MYTEQYLYYELTKTKHQLQPNDFHQIVNAYSLAYANLQNPKHITESQQRLLQRISPKNYENETWCTPW